jgi:hypothetical protein
MKKNLLFLLFSFFIIQQITQAQPFLGVHSSNYDALRNQSFNPALPGTSLQKWQFNLVAVDFDGANDYFSINGKIKDLINNFDKDVNIIENTSNESANLQVRTDVFAPSFFFNTKRAGAFAFSSRVRTITRINDVNTGLLTSVVNDANNIYKWVNEIEDFKLDVNTHTFGEMAIGYSKPIKIGDRHTLTVGGNFKLLTRGASGKFTAENISINIDTIAQTANFGESKITSYVSDMIDYFIDDIEESKYKFGIHGFGGDVGFVYELKKKESTELVNKKGKKSVRPDYIFKAGVALNDIGSLKYNASRYSRDFQATNTTVDLADITDADSAFIDFDEVLDALGNNEKFEGSFRTQLPMHLTFFFDYRVTKGFFVNFSSLINTGTFNSDTKAKAKLQNVYTLTPRFELPIVGIQVPMSYNRINGFDMGASLRFNNIIVGSHNFLSYLWRKNADAINVHLAIAFGGMMKTKHIASKKSKSKEKEESEN